MAEARPPTARLAGEPFSYASGRNRAMTMYIVVFGGIAAIVWIVILLDWLGRRKDRSQRRPAA